MLPLRRLAIWDVHEKMIVRQFHRFEFHRNKGRHRLGLNKGPCDLLSDVAHIRPLTAAAAAAGITTVERIEEPDRGKSQNSFRHDPNEKI